MRILVVEDDDINRIVAGRLLERRGHHVVVVDSGVAALALLGKQRFHCVFMDVEMPGLTGPETLSRLRDTLAFGESAATPVVAMTAHAADDYRERMLAQGFDDYLPKPLDLREIDEALRRIVGNDARDVGGICGRPTSHARSHR